MISGKFAITTHILVLLAKNSDQYISSDYIAGSININPVLVRNEIVNLKKHNLVEGKGGKNGGIKLLINPSDITLKTIFEVTIEKSSLGFSRNTPNPNCPVGKNINVHLNTVYQEIDKLTSDYLGKTTLKEFSNQF